MSNTKLIATSFIIDKNYSRDDITFMLPGILYRKYKNNNILFDNLVSETIGIERDDVIDKSQFNAVINYYENMYLVVNEVLDKTLSENVTKILSMEKTDIVEIELDKNNDLFMLVEGI